ncbi:MAG: hypothetical protein JW854_07135 [Actinobacteria bacterium]|nr:hypothetical protein [Actinomycetota bacterium]
MFSLDMGLLWTYLASMLGVLVATGLTIGLVAWYTEARKQRAGGETEAVRAGRGETRRESRRHIAHGV